MNTENGSNTQTDLSRVLAKITEIATASATGDYIYRGESETHDKVSSNLYREYPHTEGIHSNIASVQKKILEEAKTYIGKTDDIDETDDIGILTQLQHFGGKTNLIDFTEDYLIALFFACDGSHEKEGRVILLKRESDDYTVETPRRAINRVESQKSVFVESPKGFVEPDIVVTIPIDLKFPMLNYLQKYHRISIATIYNDLHGFIRRSAYIEFLRGFNSQNKAGEAKTRGEKHEHYENAVKHYTEALKLKPDFAEAYNNRGNAYQDKGEIDRAIQDFNTAIDLNPEYAVVYNNRGNAYSKKGEFDRAIQDYNTAIDLNSEYALAYNNRGNAYSEKGEVDRAIQDFNTAIDLNPEFALAYNNRGNAYTDKDNLDRAIQDFNTAIDLNPEFALAYNNRGNAYYNKGDMDNAIQDYNRAIEFNHEDTVAYNNRGVAYAKKGEFDTAIENYIKAIDLNPEFADAYYNRGEAWLPLGEWEKAKTDISTAKNMGVDILASFHNDYESVEDFEAKHGVEVPEDIAALLKGD